MSLGQQAALLVRKRSPKPDIVSASQSPRPHFFQTASWAPEASTAKGNDRCRQAGVCCKTMVVGCVLRMTWPAWVAISETGAVESSCGDLRL